MNVLLAGVTFTPTLNYNTNFSIATSVDDGVAPAITGSKAFTATAINDAPTATNLNAAESYTEDTPLNLTDIVVSDMDSASITVTLTLSDNGAGNLSTATSGGVTSTFVGGVWTASGAIADVNVLLAGVTFNPTLNYNSNFTIATSVDDGVAPAITGSKVFTATAVNDAAVIAGDDTGLVTEDFDPDSDTLLETSGTLTVTDPDTGEASFTAATIGGTYGSLTIDAAGNWDYAADNTQLAIQSLTSGESLTESITITSFDGTAHNVVITIDGVNDAPVAQDDNAPPAIPSVDEGGSQILDLSFNDTDIDNAIDLSSIVITTAPLNGSLVINGDGTVTYTHNGSETVSDSFNYTISDITGAVSNIATVSLVINPVNDAPVAQDDNTLTVNEGSTAIFDLAFNDNDSDDGLDLNSITIISAPSNASIGGLVVNGDGTVTYTHDGSETLSDSFTYTIADVSGAISNVATANIVINPVNDAPTTVGITNVTVLEDSVNTSVDLNAAFNDADNPDSELSYSIVGNTNIGLFSSTNIDVGTGQLSLDYAADNNGSSQITVRATDLAGASVDTLFTVNVTPVNDVSVVDTNTGVLISDVSEKIIDTSMLNAFDIDNALSEIRYIVTDLPDNGTLLLNGVAMGVNDSFTQADLVSGNVSYQVGINPSASDQFSFTVTDGSSTLSAMNFNITIGLIPVDKVDPVEPVTDPVDPEPPVTEVIDSIQTVNSPKVSTGSGFDSGFNAIGHSGKVSTPSAPFKNIETTETLVEDPLVNREVTSYDLKAATSFEDIKVKSIKALWLAIDQMRENIDNNITENMTEAELKAAVVSSSGVALTAGVVAWVLRSGALMTSLISTIPLWKGYDPMPILAKSNDDEDEVDSLNEDMIPTSLADVKKLRAINEKMKNYNQVDKMFTGVEARE